MNSRKEIAPSDKIWATIVSFRASFSVLESNSHRTYLSYQQEGAILYWVELGR